MIKKFSDHRRELAYLIGAVILALMIIVYMFFLIHLLSQKANEVFGDVKAPAVGGHYDFKKFYKLFPDSAPEGYVIPTSTASSTTAPPRP